jgi:hypothetical protein
MRCTNRSIIARHLPLRLSPEQIQRPMEVLTTFFSGLNLDETREVLWEAFSRALCTREEDRLNLTNSELLYFHEEFEALIEAAYLIYAKENNLPIMTMLPLGKDS